ncbi:MAG TPA: GNAT family N-acetyltransferase [Treponemataceae bacterium]|nr:GNAT family N-acetyltransferase [Treponemataceae bacterium]HPS44789.1 GNAT family N-acetyltransferase [Treponemataceae bacterium]
MTIETRDIPKTDIACIKTLWEELNRIHLRDSVNFKDHYSAFTFEKRMETLLACNDSNLKITVAFSGPTALGYCISTIAGMDGEVDSLCLHESIRGEGIGKELVQGQVAWMKARGCRRIRVSVSHGHDSVLGFYRKLGFKERLMVLELKD